MYSTWYGLFGYRDFKDLAKRTASDKVLRDKAFNIAKNPKYDGYQRGLASMVYKFFTVCLKCAKRFICIYTNVWLLWLFLINCDYNLKYIG